MRLCMLSSKWLWSVGAKLEYGPQMTSSASLIFRQHTHCGWPLFLSPEWAFLLSLSWKKCQNLVVSSQSARDRSSLDPSHLFNLCLFASEPTLFHGIKMVSGMFLMILTILQSLLSGASWKYFGDPRPYLGPYMSIAYHKADLPGSREASAETAAGLRQM